MKLIILEDVEQLTERYHSSGGLVIVSENIESAKELIKNNK